MRAALATLVLLLVSLGAAQADWRSAMSAYDQGDYRTAFTEFEQLAHQDDPDAQYMLGRMYARGQGVVQDYVQAHKWFNLAASRGHRDAPRARDDIAQRMTPNQIAEAQRLAREWQPGGGGSAAQRADQAQETVGPGTVADIQRILNDLGYDAGPPDGVLGPQTRGAIRTYQSDSGLPATGEPSSELRAHLESTAAARRPAAAAETPAAAAEAPAAAAATEPPSEDAQALVERLQALIREAERERSADPRFLERLRELAGRYDWPWRRVLVQDSFEDGDYTRDPSWKVDSGRFWVESGAGLRTRTEVRERSGSAGQGQGENLTGAIIGAILEQTMRGEGERPAPGAEHAQIRLPQRIPNAFAVRVRLASGESQGRLELGLYQAASGNPGYGLVYNPGATPGLELVRRTGGGSAVVEAYPEQLKLEDGEFHEVQWTRDASGRMSVSVDGEQLFQVTDRGVRQPFDGVAVVNRGGSYTLRSITVFGAE